MIVLDALQIAHIIWEDINLGLMYAKVQNGVLDAPALINAPFKPGGNTQLSDLKLVPDPLGRLHAFWLNQRGELFYSLNNGVPLTNRNAWSLASSQIDYGLDVDAAADAKGRLHMLYINGEDTNYAPAGIYCRSLEAGGRIWSRPVLLYQSQYFRSTSREDANVRIVTAGTSEAPLIYAVWDNHLRRSVFLTSSADGGKSWREPIEVDRPSAERTYASPRNIRIAASGNTALVLWQSISSSVDNSCLQYYQWSSDGGISWSPTQELEHEFSACPENNQILTNSKGEYFLVSSVQEQVYISLWNGSQWSEPQLQDPLYSFQDPELFSFVQYQCKSIALDNSDRMIIVGCDVGDGADIWLMSRSISDTSAWYPKPSIWSDPVQIASQPHEMGGVEALSDAQGRVHVFWSQAGENGQSGTIPGQHTSIGYNYWDGEIWTQPFAILKSPEGKADQPAPAIDPEGRLYVVWSGGVSGEIYFSWANITQTSTPSGWAPPLLISAPESLAVSPDILVDKSGFIKVVYAIPINERRGIYFTQSQDFGETWSAPVQIFSGVTAGWEKVNYPKLTRTLNGDLHLLWSRYSLNSDEVGSSLVYTRSEDGGVTWIGPEIVVEEPVSWSEIVGSGEKTVHRIWQQVIGDQNGIKFQISEDGGFSWQSSDTIFTFTGFSANYLTQDVAEQLHLMWAGKNNLGQQVIDYWKWQDTRWVVEEGLSVSPDSLNHVSQVAAAVRQPGEMVLVYAGSGLNLEQGVEEGRMFAATRPIQLPAIMPTPQPEPTATPESRPIEATPVLNQTPTTAPIPEGTPQEPLENPIASDVTLVVLAIGSGMAIMSVFIAVLMRLLRSR